MDKKEAYKIVFEDLTSSNSPNLFKGNYDARHGQDSYMYGIGTVMECIAYRVSDETGDEFSDLFVENLIASEEKCNIDL